MSAARVFQDGIALSFVTVKRFHDVLVIEKNCSEPYWTKLDYQRKLQDRRVVGLVASIGAETVGFIFYRVNVSGDSIRILSLAVSPEFRRKYVATRFLQEIRNRNGMKSIKVDVHERNQLALKFFQARGFLATGVNFGKFGADDAYEMELLPLALMV